jgi:hypothetical protein
VQSLGFETLEVLLILLPGFLSSTILSALTVRKDRTELDKIVEALACSFILWVIWGAFVLKHPLGIEVERVSDKTTRYYFSISWTEFFWLFLIALVLGLAMSAFQTNDIHTKLLRRLWITRATTRTSVWDDAFSDIQRFVLVEFSDGRRVMGWPRYISNTPEESSLFLEYASWVLDDGTEQVIDGPGMLITKNMSVQNIVFLDPQVESKDGEKPSGAKTVGTSGVTG